MKKRTKSLLALLLAVLMLLSFAPMAFADGDEGEEATVMETITVSVDLIWDEEIVCSPEDVDEVTFVTDDTSAAATVDANVVVETDDDSDDPTGVDVSAIGEDASASATVEGAVTVTGKDDVCGVNAEAGYEGSATVEAEGISTTSLGTDDERYSYCTGVYGNAYGEGTATITIGEGGISAVSEGEVDNGYAWAVKVDSYGESDVIVTVDGDVTADAEYGGAYGVQSRAEGSSVHVTVNGDVSATGDYAYGIYSYAEGEEDFYELASVQQAGGRRALSTVSTDATDENEVVIAVNGDVYGETFGVYMDGTGTQTVIVDGTLSGGLSPIWVEDFSTLGNEDTALIAWKIEIPEISDEVAAAYGEDIVEMAREMFMNLINYIIRLTQPDEGEVTLEGVEEKEGYQVAKDSARVTLKPAENYEIVRAYNKADGEEIALQQDEDGTYYVLVPFGGGLDLGVELVYVEPAPAPARVRAPKQEERPILVAVTVTLEDGTAVEATFYEDGGYLFVFDGVEETGTFDYVDGKLIVTNEAGVEMEIVEDENPENGGKLQYQFAGDPEKVVELTFDAATVALLKTKA